ncbi:predicted protein [Plenodomus lingam JN3]|uniref:Predicted protein n=1 Tax=Leptosphaeria maculans (strain JN3 / isolate v23.1.3 / race Av1-4-5-6-7-8) TaxID=985895 RepID=E4ZYX0_LEPMJ|nr:predicted protein [Plenodomus lingam JN3]CBX96405.1 predicted protein [Plenodomus lingam JN3]
MDNASCGLANSTSPPAHYTVYAVPRFPDQSSLHRRSLRNSTCDLRRIATQNSAVLTLP